jgi:tetratricopeptide (TPR) repeat protein
MYMEENQDLGIIEKIDIITKVCKGLNYAHGKNIVHRDIKPANIMILKDRKVKITDFGIAHLESSHITRTGMVVGTPDYMSPEQVLSKKVDNRSDIFSIGVILYQMMGNRKPFQAETVSSVMYKIANSQPPTFDALNIKIPFEVETIISRALEKDPMKRYQSMEMMLSDLRASRKLLMKDEPEETVGAMAQTKFMVDEAERLIKEDRPEEALAVLNKTYEKEQDNQVIAKLIRKAETNLLKQKNLRTKNILLRAETAAASGKYEEALLIAQAAFEIVPDSQSVKTFMEKIRNKIKEKTGETIDHIETRIIEAYEISKKAKKRAEAGEDTISKAKDLDFHTTGTKAVLQALPKEIRMEIEDSDRIYYQRRSIVEVVFSINKLMKTLSKDADSYEALWRLSRNYYMKGILVTSISEQKRAYNQGIAWGKRAIEVIDKRAEGHYWLAVNLAKWSDVNGIFRGVVLVKKILGELDKVIHLDDHYSGGGGYRVIGRLKARMPTIVGGNNKEAIEYLKKSLIIEPRHPDTLIFLAEALIAEKEYNQAKQHLDKLIKMEPHSQWRFETHHNRKIAEELLTKINKEINQST